MPTNEERSARPHRFAPSPSERAAERRVSGAPERLAGRVLHPHPLQQLVDFAGDRRERLARLLGARDHHRPFAERAEEEVHERLRRPRADESSGHRVAQAHLQQAERIAGVDLPPGLPAEHDGAVAQDDLLDLAVGAGLTWRAGVELARTTDALDARLHLGEEIGGIVLLAIAGSLPELAITVSAAAQGNLDLAAGNLIGGIAVQTMVLVLCDFAVGPERPLTFLVGALTPVLEAMMVVLVATRTGMVTSCVPSKAARTGDLPIPRWR